VDLASIIGVQMEEGQIDLTIVNENLPPNPIKAALGLRIDVY
jgi:hypothetical protein